MNHHHSSRDACQLELAKLYFEQAVAAGATGRHGDACSLYRKCLRIVPDYIEARYNLAWSLGCLRDFEGAAGELQEILSSHPEHHQARLLLGSALLDRGQPREALEHFRIVHRQHPDNREVVRRTAEALYALQRYDEARTWIECALQAQPDDYASLVVLATIERTENPGRSLSLYRTLIARNPLDHLTRYFYSTLLLSLGEFEEGWREFEHRIPTLNIAEDILAIPRWHGEALQGKSIVLVAEQGHGDAMQFVRYATLVARLGARVMVICHNRQILPILETVDGVEAVVVPNQPLPFVPDYHCPLLSLPYEMGTRGNSIPCMPGYLKPDPLKLEMWRARLARQAGLKVGIVWGGNRAQADNAKRSVPFGALQELLGIPGVSFVSLQVGPDALKYQQALDGAALLDWSDELHDFTDTAALVSSLDLVISICSAVTHLSGALEVPTWVLLQYDADWRWLRGRSNSPWYPSVRLFRQERPGEWGAPLEQVRMALAEYVAGRETGSPADADIFYGQGVARFNAGDCAGAEAFFRAALERDGRHTDSLNGLGTLLDLNGTHGEAVRMYRLALETDPQSPLVHFNLANTLRKTGANGEAEVHYRRAIEADPGFCRALAGLGNLLLKSGRPDEAEEALRASCEIDRHQPDVLGDLAVLAVQRQEHPQAEELLTRALELDGRNPVLLNQLGMLLMRLNRLDEAESYLRRALQERADYGIALNNLGVLLHWAGRLEEAEECYRRFLARDPENATAHFNFALVLLSHGKFEQGWSEYEYRFTKENPVPVRHGTLPRWQGEDLAGRTILIHAEQGYGDTIQCARYLTLLAGRGARIVLECQDRIISPLFEDMEGIDAVIVRDQVPPMVDLQLPLMSIPLVVGAPAWHEPVAVEYLKPAPGKVRVWQERLSAYAGAKVGLVWSGRRGQDNNHNRMIPPDIFAGLAGIDGLTYVNLLIGVDDPEAEKTLACLEMVDFRGEITDFSETAALLGALDLLVTVDTATAHLSGAIGRDAWVMIPYNADWRWAFGYPDCRLYPSVKLYRQEQPFAWREVVQQVRGDLVEWVHKSRALPAGALEHARQLKASLRWSEAQDAYQKVLEREPHNLEALTGVGACLQMMNRTDEAVAWYESALPAYPGDPTLHCNYAIALLNRGEYVRGWQEFQWRKTMIGDGLPPIPFLRPEQMAEDLSGKKLLLHTEQGFGDTLHCIRYVPLLAERGVTVMVSAPPELARLLRGTAGVSRVVTHGSPLPAADLQALTMDLPWLFATTAESVPASVPYLEADEGLVRVWGERLGPKTRPRVGIAWGGSSTNPINHRLRSLGIDMFAPLLDLTELDWHSLQVGGAPLAPTQKERFPRLIDHTYLIEDFADTAALICNLDHVVTIDSAVAHLAGGLGKPVSLLLPEYRDWRWLKREGRPIWYPRTKIFRINETSDIGVMRTDLCRAFAAEHKGTQP